MRIMDILDDQSDYHNEKKTSTRRLFSQFLPKFHSKTMNKKKNPDLELDLDADILVTSPHVVVELRSEMETTFKEIKREILEKYETANANVSRRRNVAESERGYLQQKLEVRSKDDAILMENSSDNSDEEEIMEDVDYETMNGVSSHELERRLHQLIKTRQQEQIEELEKALN